MAELFRPPKIPGATSLLPSSLRHPKQALDNIRREVANVPQVLANKGIEQLTKQIFPPKNADQKPLGRTGGLWNAISSRPDPKMSFEWNVIMPDISPAVPCEFNVMATVHKAPTESGKNPDGLGLDLTGGSASIHRYAESATISLPFFESEPVFQEGRMVYYPSKRDIATLQMTFYEDVMMSTLLYFDTWRNLIKNDSAYSAGFARNTYGVANQYMKEIQLRLTCSAGDRPDGQEVLELLYEKVWPTQVTGYEFNSENGRIQVSVEFAVSDMQLIYLGFDESNTKPGATAAPTMKTSKLETVDKLLKKIGDPFGQTTQGIKSVFGVAQGVSDMFKIKMNSPSTLF